MVVVLIAGGHGLGKSTTATKLRDSLRRSDANVALVNMGEFETLVNEDWDDGDQRVILVDKSGISRTALRPLRFDFDRILTEVLNLTSDHVVIIVHGLYALHDRRLRNIAQLKVYLHGDPDTRLIRWLRRDVVLGKYLLGRVLNYYVEGAKQEMTEYVMPTKEYADIILPGAEDTAVQLIVDSIEQQVSHTSKVSTPRTNMLRRREGSFFDAS
ncbi:hypothetical protein JNB11_03915 [Kocuria palustris]|nr:hypothetical protein [Kocuria palustris]